jgi:hypothetical protein
MRLFNHLDAAEGIWFARQLQAVDAQQYDVLFPENKARQLIPTQGGIPAWAESYVWREYEKLGVAEFVADDATDLKSANVKATENTRIIKQLGASYRYTVREIKQAAATRTPLDAMRAAAARFAIETKIDEVLALGDVKHGLDGFLTLSNTTSYTLGDKAGGGKTWAVATPDEIVKDIAGAITAIKIAMKGAGTQPFQMFDVVLPIGAHCDIAQRRMGDGSDTTVLQFVLRNLPHVNAITDWFRCDGAGQGSTDRMVVYPKNPTVLAGIVPEEYTPLAPQDRGLSVVVNATASCGGVVCRYPVAVAYGDGL